MDIGRILRRLLAALGWGRRAKAAPKPGEGRAGIAKPKAEAAPKSGALKEIAARPPVEAGSAGIPKPIAEKMPVEKKIPWAAAGVAPREKQKPKAVAGFAVKPKHLALPKKKPAKLPAPFGVAAKKIKKKIRRKAAGKIKVAWKKAAKPPAKGRKTPAKGRKKAALKGWATRRKRLSEKLRKLEAQAKRTVSVEVRVGKLRSQLLEARRHEVELMEQEAEKGVEAAKAEEVEGLKETVRIIERSVREQAAKAAVSVPAYAYAGAPQEVRLGIDEEIGIVKRMMKALEIEFYKRRITEEQFRERMFEYQQELNELEERKKAIGEARKTQMALPGEAGAAVGAMAAPPGIGRAAPEARLPMGAPKPRVAPSAAAAGPGIAEIQLKTIEELRKLAEAMKEEARQRAYAAGIPAARAETAPTEDIEERIMEVRGRSKALEMEFYKRRIPAEEFSKRMFEYQQEMRELEARRKAAAEAAAKGTRQKPWGAAQAAAAEKARAAPAAYEGPRPRVPPAAAVRALPMRPAAPAARTEFGRIVEKRAISGIDRGELRRLEGKMDEVITRYGIPRKEVEQKIRELSSEKILENFSRLIDLIEARKKEEAAAGPKIKAAPVETVAPGEMLKPKAAAEVVATGITKSRIVTDFDRVLAKVSEAGEMHAGKLGKGLGLEKKLLDEVLEVLEDRKLITRRYPAFGEPIVSLAGYVKPKKAKNRNRKNKQEG